MKKKSRDIINEGKAMRMQQQPILLQPYNDIKTMTENETLVRNPTDEDYKSYDLTPYIVNSEYKKTTPIKDETYRTQSPRSSLD